MGSGQNWPVAFGSRCAWKSNANPTWYLAGQIVCGYVHGCHSTYYPTSPLVVKHLEIIHLILPSFVPSQHRSRSNVSLNSHHHAQASLHTCPCELRAGSKWDRSGPCSCVELHGWAFNSSVGHSCGRIGDIGWSHQHHYSRPLQLCFWKNWQWDTFGTYL